MNGLVNVDGGIVTFLNGKFTVQHVAMAMIGLVAFSLLFKIVKKGVKLVVLVAAVCYFLVSHQILSPEQLGDVGSKLAGLGSSTIEQFAKASSYIRVEGGTLQLHYADAWHDISEVQSFVKSGDQTVKVNTPDGEFIIEDGQVVKLLELLK